MRKRKVSFLITIRGYVKNDAKITWSVFFQTVRNINIKNYSQTQVETWAPSSFDFEVWEKKMDDINPFIAELDGVVVGYSDLQEDGLIDHFFCHYQYQSMGIGKKLMEKIFNEGSKRGIVRFYSEVSITAKPFYEYFGFSVIKEQIIDIRGQKFVNFLMEKII